MLTEPEIIDIINNISYKPGVSFQVEEFFTDMVKIKASFMVTDVHNPRFQSKIESRRTIPLGYIRDGYDLLMLIEDLIKKTELHEVNEWFKYKGNCVTDPHPENPTGF